MLTTPRKPERPTLWLIAGPNGSGKSTSYNRTDIEGWGGSVWIVNPDLLTQHLIEQEGVSIKAANGEALDRIAAWLDASLAVHQTIGVETVLSSFKYRPLVKAARRLGYRIRLIYVIVDTVALQDRRIRDRVREGGHDVPSEKVAARRSRSFRQFGWFCRKSDDVYVFDNSGASAVLSAVKEAGRLKILRPLPADFDHRLRRLRVPLG